MITDLSFPPGRSVNDGINPAWCPLMYTSVEKVARAAQSLGPGALMAKTDVQAAYRLIPVHPVDRLHLGVRWHDALYVDGMLPFGSVQVTSRAWMNIYQTLKPKEMTHYPEHNHKVTNSG